MTAPIDDVSVSVSVGLCPGCPGRRWGGMVVFVASGCGWLSFDGVGGVGVDDDVFVGLLVSTLLGGAWSAVRVLPFRRGGGVGWLVGGHGVAVLSLLRRCAFSVFGFVSSIWEYVHGEGEVRLAASGATVYQRGCCHRGGRGESCHGRWQLFAGKCRCVPRRVRVRRHRCWRRYVTGVLGVRQRRPAVLYRFLSCLFVLVKSNLTKRYPLCFAPIL